MVYHRDMPDRDARTVPPLADMFTAFATGLVHSQSQLDADWANALVQYQQALPPAVADWPGAAALLAPSRQVVTEASLETQLSCRREESRTLSVRAFPVPLGYERKFAHSAYLAARVSLTVVPHSNK